MKSFRDIRVIPVVLVAIFGLAVLKIAGLVIDGGYVFDYQVSQPAQRSWAQDNLGYPTAAKADTADITGSVTWGSSDTAVAQIASASASMTSPFA